MNCNLIMQGDELYIPFIIKHNNEYLKIEEVERIQFSVGELIKYYNRTNPEEVTYDEETHQFRFPITQEESFEFSGSLKCQVRIKFTSGDIRGRVLGDIEVQNSENREVL